MKLYALFMLLAAAVAVGAEYKSYDDFSVLRVEHGGDIQEWLKQAMKLIKADVWREGAQSMDIMVPSRFVDKLIKRLESNGQKGAVIIEDVDDLIEEQREVIKKHVKTTERAIDSTTYRDFNQLMTEIDELVMAYPTMASSYDAGTTFEGRPIRVVKISSDGSDTRPAVWMDCGIHAREWVSPATCMYFLDQLTSLYGSDATVTSLLDTYDFHILPVTNPDGYAYTWADDRLWRKNRVPNTNCIGVDCNRNFDSNFAGPGSSDLPCSETYHGLSAFSEAESSAVRDATTALGSRLAGFFTIHSYSQYWMTPYGYTSTLPADYTEMMRVAGVGVEALTAVHGTQYTYGNIADIIYVASGGSSDWAYDTIGTVYAYALELRDTGHYGFLLPQEQIVPTAEETFAGVTAAIQAFA